MQFDDDFIYYGKKSVQTSLAWCDNVILPKPNTELWLLEFIII